MVVQYSYLLVVYPATSAATTKQLDLEAAFDT
jgi:hypothetical protein